MGQNWSKNRGQRLQSNLQCFLWSQCWGISCWCTWWQTPCPCLSGGRDASWGLHRSVKEEMICDNVIWSVSAWFLSYWTFWQSNPWFLPHFHTPSCCLGSLDMILLSFFKKKAFESSDELSKLCTVITFSHLPQL